MLKRFLYIQDQINHVLIDFKMGSLFPSHDEIKMITKLVKALGIVEACSRRLCSRDATLSIADQTFEFMIRELSQIDCPYARRLNGAIQVHYYDKE